MNLLDTGRGFAVAAVVVTALNLALFTGVCWIVDLFFGPYFQ